MKSLLNRLKPALGSNPAISSAIIGVLLAYGTTGCVPEAVDRAALEKKSNLSLSSTAVNAGKKDEAKSAFIYKGPHIVVGAKYDSKVEINMKELFGSEDDDSLSHTKYTMPGHEVGFGKILGEGCVKSSLEKSDTKLEYILEVDVLDELSCEKDYQGVPYIKVDAIDIDGNSVTIAIELKMEKSKEEKPNTAPVVLVEGLVFQVTDKNTDIKLSWDDLGFTDPKLIYDEEGDVIKLLEDKIDTTDFFGKVDVIDGGIKVSTSDKLLNGERSSFILRVTDGRDDAKEDLIIKIEKAK